MTPLRTYYCQNIEICSFIFLLTLLWSVSSSSSTSMPRGIELLAPGPPHFCALTHEANSKWIVQNHYFWCYVVHHLLKQRIVPSNIRQWSHLLLQWYQLLKCLSVHQLHALCIVLIKIPDHRQYSRYTGGEELLCFLSFSILLSSCCVESIRGWFHRRWKLLIM